MARTSKVDLTYLCRHCGQPVRVAASTLATPEHMNYSVLCRDKYGNLLEPNTVAEPTKWTMARVV